MPRLMQPLTVTSPYGKCRVGGFVPKYFIKGEVLRLSLVLCLLLVFVVMTVKGTAKVKDNAWERQVKKDYDERLERKKAFFERYMASEELEEECGEKTRKKDKEVFELAQRIINEAGVYPTYRTVWYAMLAERGKIPREALFTGFQVNCLDCVGGKKFAKWYDKELTAHGVEEHMVFRPEYMGEITSPQPIAEIKEGGTWGVFSWNALSPAGFSVLEPGNKNPRFDAYRKEVLLAKNRSFLVKENFPCHPATVYSERRVCEEKENEPCHLATVDVEITL